MKMPSFYLRNIISRTIKFKKPTKDQCNTRNSCSRSEKNSDERHPIFFSDRELHTCSYCRKESYNQKTVYREKMYFREMKLLST